MVKRILLLTQIQKHTRINTSKRAKPNLDNRKDIMKTSFEDYCEDHLDMHYSLMGEEQLKNAKSAYAAFCKRKASLEKAKESRKLAKFYGGSALTGTAKQKKWAEEIRQSFLESSDLTEQEKQELVTCGGFTLTAKFWIENRSVAPAKMTARNIVAQYRGLLDLRAKHDAVLSRTAPTAAKNAARKEIQDYLDYCCDFSFE